MQTKIFEKNDFIDEAVFLRNSDYTELKLKIDLSMMPVLTVFC